MGNCATKPKTKGDDEEAPPPAEPQTPGRAAAEGERKEEKVAAPEETRGQEPVEEASLAVVAPKSEEAITAIAETKEPDEPKEEAPKNDDADHGNEKEAAAADAELPAAIPAKVA